MNSVRPAFVKGTPVSRVVVLATTTTEPGIAAEGALPTRTLVPSLASMETSIKDKRAARVD
jgi:hypothetical protein